jgi:hypothetical protein
MTYSAGPARISPVRRISAEIAPVARRDEPGAAGGVDRGAGAVPPLVPQPARARRLQHRERRDLRDEPLGDRVVAPVVGHLEDVGVERAGRDHPPPGRAA